MTEEEIRSARSLIQYFEERKLRASERLTAIQGKWWCFAIIGLGYDQSLSEFSSHLRFQPVVEPPGEVELAAALSNKAIFSAVGRYTKWINCELLVSREFFSDEQGAFNVAWWLISALRVRALAEILVVAVADHSWSTIAGITDNSCSVQLLEDVPRARMLGESIKVSREDANWVGSNFLNFAQLLQLPKFRLAAESLCEHHLLGNERMMVATLWSGIEALFEIQSELRFRLAVLVACLLQPRGDSRIALYRAVKKLYDVRSKAVHGSSLAKDQIESHIREVRVLLSRLLCQFSENGSLPDEKQLENVIFG